MGKMKMGKMCKEGTGQEGKRGRNNRCERRGNLFGDATGISGEMNLCSLLPGSCRLAYIFGWCRNVRSCEICL